MENYICASKSTEMTKIQSLCALVLVTLIGALYGQTRENYNLLWKIEGPGDIAPSYLFGTAHISHPKAFEFSDSVLFAFDKCEVLALEISIDDYMREISQNKSEKKNNQIKEELSAEEYEKLKKLIKEEVDINIDDLKTTSPLIIRRLLAERFSKNDRSKLTVDNYLYDVAKGQGMDVVGLEPIDKGTRGANGFNSTFEKELFVRDLIDSNSTISFIRENAKAMEKVADNRFDDFIDMYYQGDVEVIFQSYNEHAQNFGDRYKVTERNYLMADGIDSLVKLSSTFTAVGAAHLGGEEGLIQILRNRGYKLSPVAATFNGHAKSQKRKFEETAGYLLEKLGEGYRIQLPGKPVEAKIQNSNLKMYTYQDVSNGNTRLILSIESPDLLQDEKRIFESVVEQMSAKLGGSLHSTQHFTHYGVPGYRAVMASNDLSMLVFLFKKDSRVYIFGESKGGKSYSKSDPANFLKTIELFDFTAEASGWELVHNEKDNFSIELPSKHSYLEKDFPVDFSEEDFTTTQTYSAVNSKSKTSFIVNVLRYPLGYYVETDSTIIESYQESITEEYGVQLVDSARIENGTYPIYTATYANPENGHFVVNYMIMRGNRVYNMLCQSTDSLNEEMQLFLNSFKLDEAKIEGGFTTMYSPDSSFSILLPEKRDEFNEEYMYDYQINDMTSLNAADAANNILVALYLYDYNKFTYYPTPDSLIQSHYVKLDEKYKTVLLDTSFYKDGTLYARERVVADSRVSYTVRDMVYLNGSKVYQLQAMVANEFEYAEADRIFNSIKILKPDTISLYTRKTGQVLANLQSTDSATFAVAKSFISGYDFDSIEVGLLYNALVTSMPLDTGYWAYSTVKGNLIRKFKTAYDSNSVGFLMSYYDTITSDLDLKRVIFDVLAEMGDSLATQHYLSLFDSVDFEVYRLGYFYDTITRVHSNLELLFDGLKNPYLRGPIVDVFSFYLTKDSTFVEQLKPQHFIFKDIYKQMLDTISISSMGYESGSEIYGVLNVLTRLGGAPDLVDQTYKLLNANHYSTRVAAVLELLKHGVSIKKKDFKKLLENKEESYELLYSLNKNGYQNLLSANVDQKQVAEIFVRSELYYEDYYEVDLKLLEIATTQLNGERVRVYIYAYTSEYDDTPYLAYTAAQPDSKEINFEEGYTSTWAGEYTSSTYEKRKKEIIEEVVGYLTKKPD